MRTQLVSMFLCLSLGLAAAQAQLKIDFGQTGGTAAVESGYQGYFATDKNAASFSAQTYSAFETTVTVKVSFAPGAPAAGMRAIDRSTDDGITSGANLLRDWVGADTRQAGTDPTIVTISGLPAGTYEWLSYHHDAHDQTGIFNATVNDATGAATTTGIDISNTTGGTVNTLEGATKFTAKITANGKDDVTLVFRMTSGGGAVANAIFVINAFELTALDIRTALLVTPAGQATDVPRDGTALSWIPNKSAVSHDVYLGTDFDDIDDGTTTSATYLGRQDTTSYALGRLEFGKTYYWRIDEIASDGTPTKGDVWSFTVEPANIAIAGGRISATASSVNPGSGPEKTIDGSGLDANDCHSTELTQMWLTAANAPEPAWIQYEFDKAYKLQEMWVWNSNQALETLIGFGAKTVTVEFSADGAAWQTLGDVELAQATGETTYAHNTTVDFKGQMARYVKLTVRDNWGGIVKQYGLSEVRFTMTPVFARQPVPADSATGVDPRLPLTWRAGRGAASHKVYLSTDVNEVRNGTAQVGTVSEASFDASNSLGLGKTYYWKIDEVNDSEAQATWEGDVWSFSVQQYLPVDDFESYANSSPNRVFQHWIDGLGFSEDEYFPKGNPGNGSGALVGYDPLAGDIMELVTVHGGAQSMPVAYDSSSTPYSEAERTFDPPQDWTVFGVKALTLWFQGKPENTATKMYVKVNGAKVAYAGDDQNIFSKPWHLWYVPLADLTGVNLKKVTTLTIGFEGGAGMMFIDDIGLTPADRQLVTPVAPAATNLVAFYAFENNLNSSTGAFPGTAVGAPTYTAGKVGQAVKLNGAADHITMQGSLDLPVYTAAVWFRVEGGTNQRDIFSVYDDGGLHGILLEIEANGVLRYLHRAPIGSTTEVNVRNRGGFDDGAWYHAAIVKTPEAAMLYINGIQVAREAIATSFDHPLTRMTVGVLKHDSLSRYFPGEIDELYLYSRVLSAAEIASLAGQTQPFDQ